MATARIVGGASRLTAEVGLAAAVPLHTVNRMIPHTSGTGGHYRIAATSGTIAAALAALAQLFYVKNVHASQLMVIMMLRAKFQPLTPFTANTLTDFGFDLIRATAASAGGGGTDLGATAKPAMRNTAMGTSLTDVAGAMRIATTGALTALTTVEANSIAQSVGDTQRVNPAAATEEVYAKDPELLFRPDVASGEAPLILLPGEGLVLRNRAVWPAAGTGILQVEMAWAEVPSY